MLTLETYVTRDVLTPDQVCGDVVSLLHNVSSLVCAINCWTQVSMCFMFAFNNITRACLLYGGLTYHNGTYPLPLTPFVTFKGLSNCERSGYVHAMKETLCYKLFETPLTWLEARTACEEDQGRLVVIQTTDQVEYFMNQMPGSTPVAFWIGLSNKNSNWEWEDSSTLDYSVWHLIELNGYDSGYPSDPHSADCGTVNRDSKHIIDSHCQRSFQFVCERPHLL